MAFRKVKSSKWKVTSSERTLYFDTKSEANMVARGIRAILKKDAGGGKRGAVRVKKVGS